MVHETFLVYMVLRPSSCTWYWDLPRVHGTWDLPRVHGIETFLVYMVHETFLVYMVHETFLVYMVHETFLVYMVFYEEGLRKSTFHLAGVSSTPNVALSAPHALVWVSSWQCGAIGHQTPWPSSPTPHTRIHVALSTPQTLGQHPPHIPVYIWLFLRRWLWVSSCQCAITVPTYPYTCCSFNSTDSGSLDAITHPTYPYKCCSFYSTDSGSAAVSVSTPTPHTCINIALSTPETLGQQMASPTPHTRINVVLSAPGQHMPSPTPCTCTNVARSTPQTLGQQIRHHPPHVPV